MFRAAAPDEVELFMSFGSAMTSSGGAWQLQCEEVYQDITARSGPTNQVLTPNGALVNAHQKGLLVSRDGGCNFQLATGGPLDPLGMALPVYDVGLDAASPDTRFWMTIDDSIYKSEDGGASISPARVLTGHLVIQIQTSPTQGGVVYVTSVSPGDGGSQFNFVSTQDGFATAPTINPSPFRGDDVQIKRVSPSNPDTIYFTRRGTDGSHKLYVSRDRGRTASLLFDATTVATPPADALLQLALGAAPGELWVGVKGDDIVSDAGSLHRSTDDGATWTRIQARQPHFRCLELWQGKLWGCGNNVLASTGGDTFALGVSSDGGLTWQKKFAFGELCTPISCQASLCSQVLAGSCVAGLCTPGQDGGTPDAASDAATDGARSEATDGPAADRPPDAGVDGPATPPAEDGGCGGCSAGAAAAPGGLAWGLLALYGLLRKRRIPTRPGRGP